jgi:hypothetical protein
MEYKGARYLNVLLGIWLFISAFVWPHSPSQYTNTWLMGLIAIAAALIALAVPAIRFVNTAVGIWLIIASFALPRLTAATAWNNVLVGAVILVVSLAGPHTTTASPRRFQPTT